MTHLVDGTPWMGPREKEHFRKLMRAYETFCGLHMLTYAILGVAARHTLCYIALYVFLPVEQGEERADQS